MIICPRCGKENQDHYKFCLGCGAELKEADDAAAAPPPPEPVADPRRGVPPTGRQAPLGAEAGSNPAPENPHAPPPFPGPAPSPFAAAGPEAAPSPFAPTGQPPAGPPPAEPPALEPQPFAAADATPAETAEPVPGPVASEPVVSEPVASRPGATDPGTPEAPEPGQESGDPPCPNCGHRNPEGFAFCGNCGTRLKPAEQAQPIASGPGAAPEAAPPATQSGPALARLALIRPDGSEGGSHLVTEAETIIGRGTGPLFDNDSYLSPQHVRVVIEQDQITLEDQSSLNGVFVRLTSDEEIFDTDVFRIGQELLRFDAIGDPLPTDDGTEVLGSPNPGYWGRLSLIVRRGIDGSSFPLMGEEMVLGRERGDILFSDDGYVSGLHAKLWITQEGSVFLADLGSSNGTFIRLTQPRTVPFGTFVLMGQQLFRIEAP